jgi:hypothetical protein
MTARGAGPLHVKLILPALSEATSPYWRPIKYSLFPPLGLATIAARGGADRRVSLRGTIPVCDSWRACPAFSSYWMCSPASRSVTNSPPSGGTIGSSKRADHGTIAHAAGQQQSPQPRSISSMTVRQVLSFIR